MLDDEEEEEEDLEIEAGALDMEEAELEQLLQAQEEEEQDEEEDEPHAMEEDAPQSLPLETVSVPDKVKEEDNNKAEKETIKASQTNTMRTTRASKARAEQSKYSHLIVIYQPGSGMPDLKGEIGKDIEVRVAAKYLCTKNKEV